MNEEKKLSFYVACRSAAKAKEILASSPSEIEYIGAKSYLAALEGPEVQKLVEALEKIKRADPTHWPGAFAAVIHEAKEALVAYRQSKASGEEK